jgi:hypothetical protein
LGDPPLPPLNYTRVQRSGHHVTPAGGVVVKKDMEPKEKENLLRLQDGEPTEKN